MCVCERLCCTVEHLAKCLLSVSVENMVYIVISAFYNCLPATYGLMAACVSVCVCPCAVTQVPCFSEELVWCWGLI